MELLFLPDETTVAVAAALCVSNNEKIKFISVQ